MVFLFMIFIVGLITMLVGMYIDGDLTFIVGVIIVSLSIIGGLCSVFKSNPKPTEVKAKQVQIDTMYTTLSGKTDTTYIIKYFR